MKTIFNFLTFAALLTILFFTSCEQDNLMTGTEDLELQDTAQEREEVMIEEALVETIDSAMLDTTKTFSEVETRSSHLVYSSVASVSQGSYWLKQIHKSLLDPAYRYVVKITPYSGDPDIYIHGYDGSYRTIRNGVRYNLTPEQTYGHLSDLTSSEYRLYFSVYGYQSSTFKIEIFKQYYCPTGCLQGRYTIQSAIASKYLDVQWGSTATGTPLHIWPYNGGAAQRWRLYSDGNGYYYLRSDLGKYLDVKNASSASGTPVWMYPYNGSVAQKFRLIPLGNGYYYVRSKLGTYLDVKWANSASGTPIWMYQFTGSNAQKWRLRAI